MQLDDLVRKLDNDFFKTKIIEDHTAWPITEKTKGYVDDDFINKSTGLMFRFNKSVGKVFTTVFVTDEIIDKICDIENSLLFTHHHFNYYEDKRELMLISVEQI